MTRVAIRPEMLRWAVERAGLVPDDLQARFTKFPEWLEGEVHPTLKQLENFAKVVHVPFGYLVFVRAARRGVADFRFSHA